MPNYVYFLLAVAGLIVGYIIYGSIVAKIFGADENRPTPAKTMADGVDYVEMPMWKVWLIQLLNIAGVGPVFGPILGALSGFHATQSPLMSRCLSNEKQGKAVFYGGMVAEGFIGLVWATVGMTFYTSPEALAAAGGPPTWSTRPPAPSWAPSAACWPSWAWWPCPSPPVTRPSVPPA